MHVESICSPLDISAVNQIVIQDVHQICFVAVIVSCNVDNGRMSQIADIRMAVPANKFFDRIVNQNEHLVFFEGQNPLFGSVQVETKAARLREQRGVRAQHGEVARGISDTEQTAVRGKPVFDSSRKREMKQLAVIAAQHNNVLFLAHNGIEWKECLKCKKQCVDITVLRMEEKQLDVKSGNFCIRKKCIHDIVCCDQFSVKNLLPDLIR